MDFLPHLIAVSGLLALLFLYKQRRIFNPTSKVKSPPEPSGAWPVIGHLQQLNTKLPLARTLGAMADKYGSIFTLRLGMKQALVVISWEAVKECFTKNDKIFSSRPTSSFGTYLCYNYASFGIAPYGPYWREIRRIVLQELLSNQRLEKLKHVRISEIETRIKGLFNAWKSNATPAKVDIGQWFEQLFVNIIVRKIAGMRYTDSEVGTQRNAHFKGLVKEFFYLGGQFVVSDVIPFPLLRWLDPQGIIKSLKRISRELDICTQIWIDEHHERRKGNEPGEEKDLIDVMRSVIKDESMFGHSRETVIKSTALSLILAASDSTPLHFTWLVSLLLNNPCSMEKAREEIDMNVGKERWVEESDIKNLVYLQAIVKEALRLYPPGPLSFPCQATEDCHVGGYFIPKGTQLFVNIWKLQRDPKIWSESDKFLPERFLQSPVGAAGVEIDVSGRDLDFCFTPFGSGRRICPGIQLATLATHLTLARLLQGFDFTTPLNLPVDMTEGLGMNMPKTKPLEVLIMPRLHNYVLYG